MVALNALTMPMIRASFTDSGYLPGRVRAVLEQYLESRLVQYRHLERERLLVLRPGRFPDDHEVGLLRDAATRLAAPGRDGLGGLVAGVPGQAPGDHDGHALQRAGPLVG